MASSNNEERKECHVKKEDKLEILMREIAEELCRMKIQQDTILELEANIQKLKDAGQGNSKEYAQYSINLWNHHCVVLDEEAKVKKALIDRVYAEKIRNENERRKKKKALKLAIRKNQLELLAMQQPGVIFPRLLVKEEALERRVASLKCGSLVPKI